MRNEATLRIDARDIESLVVEYYPLVEQVVRGTCSRGVPTYIESDDLIQECALRLPQAIRDYRGEAGASMKTYLKAVIRRDVLDVIKRERREPIHGCRTGGDLTALCEAESDDPESRNVAFKSAVYEHSMEMGSLNARRADNTDSRLGDWRNLLTAEQVQVVELCHIDRMTQEEAATRLGITRNAVKSRLLKASARLQKQQSEKITTIFR